MENEAVTIDSYKDLDVWRKSMQLSKDVYQLANKLPKSETYGLSSQLQRSAVSIPSNIAEGSRRSSKDFKRFLRMALGSASELETQLLLVGDIYDVEVSSCLDKLEDIHKMLIVFIQKLSEK